VLSFRLDPPLRRDVAKYLIISRANLQPLITTELKGCGDSFALISSSMSNRNSQATNDHQVDPPCQAEGESSLRPTSNKF